MNVPAREQSRDLWETLAEQGVIQEWIAPCLIALEQAHLLTTHECLSSV